MTTSGQPLASEKWILQDKLACGDQLDTDVNTIGAATLKNPVSETLIGRYRPLTKKIYTTAEVETIKSYLDRGIEPPSFLEAGPREYLRFDPTGVRIGILTAGGIAPGLNTVIHSLVSMHHKMYRMERKALGFRGGFRGLAENRYMELEPSITRDWLQKGGSGLTTSRGEQDLAKMASNLEHLGVDILYVIGGEGSLTGAHRIAEELRQRGSEIVIAGIPKTMDNDILWVWHSFGFDTAVEEATKFINAMHEEARSSERVCLLSLFGRDAGFVAAHAALASGQVDVVLVPEMQFRIESLLQYVQKVVQDKHYALIVVAEGAYPAGYTEDNVKAELISRGLDPEDRSNPRVARALRDWKLHSIQSSFENHFRKFQDGRIGVFVQEPRYLIRAIPANSVDQIYCQRLADMAVHNALARYTDFMISQWLTEYVLVPLKLVAKGHKKIPPGGIFWTTVTGSTGQPAFD
jgi:6-phosphofructokinase 1